MALVDIVCSGISSRGVLARLAVFGGRAARATAAGSSHCCRSLYLLVQDVVRSFPLTHAYSRARTRTPRRVAMHGGLGYTSLPVTSTHRFEL
eukprot:7120963-Prymnesium_polylepis.1